MIKILFIYICGIFAASVALSDPHFLSNNYSYTVKDSSREGRLWPRVPKDELFVCDIPRVSAKSPMQLKRIMNLSWFRQCELQREEKEMAYKELREKFDGNRFNPQVYEQPYKPPKIPEKHGLSFPYEPQVNKGPRGTML